MKSISIRTHTLNRKLFVPVKAIIKPYLMLMVVLDHCAFLVIFAPLPGDLRRGRAGSATKELDVTAFQLHSCIGPHCDAGWFTIA